MATSRSAKHAQPKDAPASLGSGRRWLDRRSAAAGRRRVWPDRRCPDGAERAHAPAAALWCAEWRPRARSRDHLGARRSAGAHDGRMGDHRALPRCAPGAWPGGARGQRFHREAGSGGLAARSARVLPRRDGRSGRPQARERAGRMQLLDAACGQARRPLRLVGRYRRARLGHQPRLGCA